MLIPVFRPEFSRVNRIVFVIIFLTIQIVPPEITAAELIEDHAQHPGVYLGQELPPASLPASRLVDWCSATSKTPSAKRATNSGVGEAQSGGSVDDDVVEFPPQLLEEILVRLGIQELGRVGRNRASRDEEQIVHFRYA